MKSILAYIQALALAQAVAAQVPTVSLAYLRVTFVIHC